MTRLDHLPPVGLAELNRTAGLLTRTDRKYVVPAADLDVVVAGVPGLRVLEVGGRRSSRYDSTYLDTVGLASWSAAAHRRRRRWKVRTRTYADSGERWLEVKTRGVRGATVKERLPHDARDVAGPAGTWVRERLAAAHVRDVDPDGLVETLHTAYLRTTLLLPGGAGRATIDRDLRWVSAHGSAEVGDVLVVETKSATPRPGPLDRRLWELGHRPVRLSKYGTGLALLTPGLPGNRWHRVTSRHLAGHLTTGGGGTPSSPGRRSSSS